jgi:hypothetical protein
VCSAVTCMDWWWFKGVKRLYSDIKAGKQARLTGTISSASLEMFCIYRILFREHGQSDMAKIGKWFRSRCICARSPARPSPNGSEPSFAATRLFLQLPSHSILATLLPNARQVPTRPMPMGYADCGNATRQAEKRATIASFFLRAFAQSQCTQRASHLSIGTSFQLVRRKSIRSSSAIAYEKRKLEKSAPRIASIAPYDDLSIAVWVYFDIFM